MRTDQRRHEKAIEAAQSIGPALAALADAARKDPAVFCQFVLRDESDGRPIELAPMHEEWHDILTKHERAVLWTHTEGGKAVPIDTKIPTPHGWRLMADVRVGDTVLARSGAPCRITAISPIQLCRPVFRVVFDDGGEALADADHRWIVHRKNTRTTARTSPPDTSAGKCACGCGRSPAPGRRYVHNHHTMKPEVMTDGTRVVTTRQMLDAGIMMDAGPRPGGGRYSRSRWSIPLAGPAQFLPRELPVDPYVLGVWLGDGDSSGTRITFHEDDRFIFDRCADRVGSHPVVRDKHSPWICRAALGPMTDRKSRDGLRAALTDMNLLDNKHIPTAYLHSSIPQRRELLAGLLDTDGYVDSKGGVEFTNTNHALALGCLELARSLGFKARIKSKRMMLNGNDVGECWVVTFHARQPVFALPRKLAGQHLEVRPMNRSDQRMIVAIDPVPSVPVKCIAVDSPDCSYLMGLDFTVTHNTSQISIGRALWEIGKNPNIRILILSSAAGGPKKIVKAIKNYIENSVEYRMTFPAIVPDKSDTTGLWRDDAFVVRRTSRSKDPTVQASGFGGSILGGRFDLIIIDDYLTAENTHSDHQRNKFYGWLKSTIEGRRTAHGRLWFIGNAWHLDDAMHRYAAEPRTFSKKYPVLVDGVSSWPEVWPLSRIKAEIENRGPIESRRSMFCDPVSDAERRFKLDYIRAALLNGDGIELAYSLVVVPSGYRTVTGVDLAVTKKTTGDETALVTIAVEERRQIRQILDVDAGRWGGPEIVSRIIDVQNRYNSQVLVESNAAQKYIKQFVVHQSAAPVKAFYTGKNKYDPAFGIESLAIEFSAGKWIVPNRGGERLGIHATMHTQVKKLLDEMLRYDPASHTGDRLMACWLAREGARLGSAPAGVGKRRRRT